MIKAIIIEDEVHAANLLQNILKEISPTTEIAAVCYDLPSGVKSIRKVQPDLVFLDIELPVYSGIQLLEFFNPSEITFSIIFTTAYHDFALKAFEMSAVDYLLKPIQEEKLRNALEKFRKKELPPNGVAYPVLEQHFHGIHKKIVVPISSGFEILNLDEIIYLQADGSYTRFHLSGGSQLVVSKNLKHFENLLETITAFFRVHRSFIVNLNFARKFLRTDGGHLFLEDKTEIPVSEDKTELLIEMLSAL